MSSHNLDIALKYASMGLAVLPLHTIKNGRCTCEYYRSEPCRTPGKHPIKSLTPNGLHQATTDTETIKRWWSDKKHANIGINCGMSNMVVFDIDVGPGLQGMEWLSRMKMVFPEIMETVIQMTPSGGLHLWYKLPPNTTAGSSISRIINGVDTRSLNGYIVAAPSIHINGKRYLYAENHGPSNHEISTIPKILIETLKEARLLNPIQHEQGTRTPGSLEDINRLYKKDRCFLDFLSKLPDDYEHASVFSWVRHYVWQAWIGTRNKNAFYLAMQLRDHGISIEDARPWMALYCKLLWEKEDRYEYIKKNDGYTPYTFDEAMLNMGNAYKRSPRSPAIPRKPDQDGEIST